ncbi:methyl-accepting chemotaxis protein [Celerinatantimonas yamalensis]|uniref:Methyl-accepting chemotaxis protein n=1 Tax=Celerinatantimonas yamalensis TaxID=559956 RepID=A0ABW9G9N3_9GAMM
MSIKHRLTLTVVVILILLGSAQIALQTVQLKRNLTDELAAQAQQSGQTTALQMHVWLQTKMRILNTISTLPHDQHFTDALWQAQRSGNFSLVYFGSAQGQMITGDPNYHKPDGYDPRLRPWYQQAQTVNLYMSAPYHDAASGELVMTLAKKTDDGVIAVDLSLNTMVKQIKSLTNESRQAFLLDQTGKILVSSHPQWLLKSLHQLSPELSARSLGKNNILTHANVAMQPSLVQLTAIANTPWYLMLSYPKAIAFASIEHSMQQAIWYGLISFLIVAAALYWTIIAAFNPLKQLHKAVDELAQGKADLTQRLDQGRQDEIGLLSRSFDKVLYRLHSIMLAISNDTAALKESANQSAQVASQSAQSLHQQQQDVTLIATALQQMSATANEVANHAGLTASTVTESRQSCEQGRQLIQTNQQQIIELAEQLEVTGANVQQLEQDNQEIGTILQTIHDIAEQTNLLALNAAIEAARAGEHGRGFAVVADEVRNLSQRTQSSTANIAELLARFTQRIQSTVAMMKQSQQRASHSVEEAHAATDAIDAIAESITQINDMATQIASAAEQQRAVSEDITCNTQAISDVSNTLHHQSNDSAKQAHSLNRIAESLHAQVMQFTL